MESVLSQATGKQPQKKKGGKKKKTSFEEYLQKSPECSENVKYLESLPSEACQTMDGSEKEEDASQTGILTANINDDLGLFLGKKKRNKKSRSLWQTDDSTVKEEVSMGAAVENDYYEGNELYTYKQLLERLMKNVKEKKQDTPKQKIHLQPPFISRHGRKVAFINFLDVCNGIRRSPKHMLLFISVELGTVCSINASNHLIAKGNFKSKHFQTVLQSYCKEYVVCAVCKSKDTVIIKKDRIHFLSCDECMSRRAVPVVKQGFMARTRDTRAN